MLTQAELEQLLQEAMKSRDSVRLETLRALKTRFQNEQIAKGAELEEADIVKLLLSEQKRRKESALSFQQGGRAELAEKELSELEIISSFLPEQMSEAEVEAKVQAFLATGSYTKADFGKVMAQLKSDLGPSADGAVLAGTLKKLLA